MKRFRGILAWTVLCFGILACKVELGSPATTPVSPALTITRSPALPESMPPDPPPVSLPVPTPKTFATVTAIEALNVRTGPAESYRKIFELLSGEVVEIVGLCTNGWIEVIYHGKAGWVNADYLESGGICQ